MYHPGAAVGPWIGTTPVRDGPGSGATEARLFPDMRVLGGSRAERDLTRPFAVAQVPIDAVESNGPGSLRDPTDECPGLIEDLDLRRILGCRIEHVAEQGTSAPGQPVRGARRDELNGLVRRPSDDSLFERCDVFQDIEPSAVGRYDQVVGLFLDHDPGHRRRRQTLLEVDPMSAVVH